MGELTPKGRKTANILRFIGGVLAWLALLAVSFGAGMGAAYIVHLIFD